MKKNSIINHGSYDKLQQEFHPTKNGDIKLSDFSHGSQKKVWWKCNNADDHEWESSIRERAKGTGCPYCCGKKVVTSNCLATTHPEITKQWHATKNKGITPFDVVAGSNMKIWMRK